MLKFFKKVLAFAVAPIAAMFATNAHAVIDTTVVLAGISDAQVAILAVVGALMALSVAIFGIVKVYRFVSSKAGA